MKRKKSKNTPSAILKNPSNAAALIKDIKKLTVEDVVVMYAYAEAIIETVREPLVILDHNLRIKTANKSFFDTFNVNKKETYKKLLFELGNGQWNIPSLKRLLKEILPKNVQLNDYEVIHEFNTIGKRTMILNARRIVLEGHKTELILLAIEDITQPREAENRLRNSEQHYRWIVEQVKDHIIYGMTKDGYITDWNKAAERITGYQKDEVIGKFHGIIYNPEDQKQKVPLQELKTAKKHEKASNERWHMAKDKSLFWGSGMVTPIRDDSGNLQGFSKIMRDITTHKEQEQRKDDFLSMASHELKTPVTTIKAYTQLLTKRIAETKDKKNAYFLKNIDNQTNRLVTLINDFLDISKIEAGKLVYSKKKFDLDDLIKKIIVDFQYMTETHKIKKVGEIKTAITGDEERIGQVLINLLTNAIKYSPGAKEIIIQLKLNKDNVTVSVQDFGMGISKSKQKYIFHKYFQVTELGEEGKKGFGLGLYITSEIVKRHKGKVWVKSIKGKGSTFYFTLPLE